MIQDLLAQWQNLKSQSAEKTFLEHHLHIPYAPRLMFNQEYQSAGAIKSSAKEAAPFTAE